MFCTKKYIFKNINWFRVLQISPTYQKNYDSMSNAMYADTFMMVLDKELGIQCPRHGLM